MWKAEWDDEPGSVEAALESITRAHQIATTAPYGPTLVVLDVALQEEKLAALRRFRNGVRLVIVEEAIIGRTPRDDGSYKTRESFGDIPDSERAGLFGEGPREEAAVNLVGMEGR